MSFRPYHGHELSSTGTMHRSHQPATPISISYTDTTVGVLEGPRWWFSNLVTQHQVPGTIKTASLQITSNSLRWLGLDAAREGAGIWHDEVPKEGQSVGMSSLNFQMVGRAVRCCGMSQLGQARAAHGPDFSYSLRGEGVAIFTTV